MLTKLFDRNTCAECKWCCSFDRNDIWEAPLVITENAAELQRRFPETRFIPLTKDYKLDLSGQFKTNDPQESVRCPFLDCKTGCVLSDKEKPFDCKIWPLRIMRKDEQLVLTLTPSCPVCNALPFETVKNFSEQGIAETIRNYAAKHPDMILPYRENYPVLTFYSAFI